MPRLGDLLCYSRGKSLLKNFGEWQKAVQNPNFNAAAHCETVVEVDIHAKKIETVGGNVLQSVTRRKLKLNEQKVLSEIHNPDQLWKRKNADCRQDRTCNQQNLNLQYWGVLLQLD